MQADSTSEPPLAPTSPFDLQLDQASARFAEQDPEGTDSALAAARATANTNEQRTRIAVLCRRLGRLELAREIFREGAVVHGSTASLSSLVEMQTDHEDLNTDKLEQQFAAAGGKERMALGFALGKIFHDRGDPERAFRYYLGGNTAMKRLAKNAGPASDRTFAFIRRNFTPDVFERYSDGGWEPARPIFIVGMPRCGSTLTEQVLSSHPDVYAGGEIPLINQILRAVTNGGKVPESRLLTSSKLSAFTTMGKMYWDTALQAIGSHNHMTDKYLNNIWAIGYIKLMFPHAKVIHVVRGALDNGFAIFRRKFNSVPFGYDLAEIGAELRLRQQVAQFWNEVLPGFVYRLSYEDLVLDFEPQVRKLIAHCGLEWNDACLDFHRNTRGVRTASVTQVRQPLFTDGIGSAEPYRPYMGDFLRALDG